MKKIFCMGSTAIFSLIALTTHANWFSLNYDNNTNNDIKVEESKINADREKSKQEFIVCDARALADALSSGNNSVKKKFETKYILNTEADYNYYMSYSTADLNVDDIRKATCDFINANQCYIYWGNVINMAMYAGKAAAQFPADTTPHYMLSPIITCDHYKK